MLPSEFVLSSAEPQGGHQMDCLYQGYRIEPFEAGRDLWHARIRRADDQPLLIGNHPFPTLEVGFAWGDRDSAISDAKHHIDRFKHRWTGPEEVRAA